MRASSQRRFISQTQSSSVSSTSICILHHGHKTLLFFCILFTIHLHLYTSASFISQSSSHPFAACHTTLLPAVTSDRHLSNPTAKVGNPDSKIEPSRTLVVVFAVGIGSFVFSFLSGIMAIKIVSLGLEAGTVIQDCPMVRRLDFILTRTITDVLPSLVKYIEQFLPAIVVPGNDEDWPILLRYPFYGMISVPLIVGFIFVLMFATRIVSDAVERRNEAESAAAALKGQ